MVPTLKDTLSKIREVLFFTVSPSSSVTMMLGSGPQLPLLGGGDVILPLHPWPDVSSSVPAHFLISKPVSNVPPIHSERTPLPVTITAGCLLWHH